MYGSYKPPFSVLRTLSMHTRLHASFYMHVVYMHMAHQVKASRGRSVAVGPGLRTSRSGHQRSGKEVILSTNFFP